MLFFIGIKMLQQFYFRFNTVFSTSNAQSVKKHSHIVSLYAKTLLLPRWILRNGIGSSESKISGVFPVIFRMELISG
jgi:hypothetical protein